MAPLAALTFWERNPPLAAVAVAKLLDVDVAPDPDPKATKDTVPTLKLSTG
jgi:glutamyl-tRNA synthetase